MEALYQPVMLPIRMSGVIMELSVPSATKEVVAAVGLKVPLQTWALSGTARDTEHSEVAVKTAKMEKAMQMKSDWEAKTTLEGVAVGSAKGVDPVEKAIRMKSG